MHEITIVDESFDLRFASDYHLSIQVGLDGFSFCILDIRRKKYIALRHIPLIVGKTQFLSRKLEAIFDQEEKLNAAYQSVSVDYSTNEAALIPKKYSPDGNFETIAALSFETGRNDLVRMDNLPGSNDTIVYGHPKELTTLLNRKYTNFEFRHKSIPLLASAYDQRNEKNNTVLINFEKKYVQMIALKNFGINLYNSFYFKTETDFMYYMLNVCLNLQIDHQVDEIILSGFLADDSGYVRQLKNYLGNVHFLKPSTRFSYGNIFEKVQKHQFASLLNSYKCV
jgi:hypothetical protein